MANRSMLFAARALPAKPGETVPVLALGEFGWDIPTLYKLLVSAAPQKCRSVVFDQQGPFAIAGDRQGGLDRLLALRAKLPANAPAIPSVDAAIAELSKPHIDHPYFLLEPGEILALGTGDMQADLQALFAEIQALRTDDMIALAKKSNEARHWATDSWSSILYYEPAGSERPPIDRDETFLTTTPSHLLANRSVLPHCAKLTKISMEIEDDPKDFAKALEALSELPGPFGLTLYGQCERLPDTIAAAKNLTSLGAGSMGLRALPAGLATLTGLTELYLQSNAFDAVPDVVRQMPRLKNLSLHHNAVRALPVWIGALQDLEMLYLDDCGLGELPEELWTLKNLKSLALSGNPKLTQLPEAIAQLHALEELRMHGCGLTGLPQNIGKLSRLRALWIADNRIRSLPESLYAMPLETLSLIGNPIRPAPWYAFWSGRRFKAKNVYWK
jgi:hypothetical protein